MSGSAVADASGPGLIVARMMAEERDRYPRGFAAATSVASATLGPLMPTSIPMIFYALIANASVGAMLLGGLVPAALLAAALMTAVADRPAAGTSRAKSAVPLARLPAHLRPRHPAAAAARHPARPDLFRPHDPNRGRRHRRRLRARAGLSLVYRTLRLRRPASR